MLHLEKIKSFNSFDCNVHNELESDITGRFYTSYSLAKILASDILNAQDLKNKQDISIIDPFCGDGRLIVSFIEALKARQVHISSLHIEIWDVDKEAIEVAKQSINEAASLSNLSIVLKTFVGDSFAHAVSINDKFDIVITNPPWENIKPDKRNFGFLSDDDYKVYVETLKEYDVFLSTHYPSSMPEKKFAGWGTNLSRTGIELSMNLLRQDGSAGIVCPASLLADKNSYRLRKELIETKKLTKVRYFPAEAKLFGKADVQSSTLVFSNTNHSKLSVVKHSKDINVSQDFVIEDYASILPKYDYVIPAYLGGFSLNLLKKLSLSPPFSALETSNKSCFKIWAGREVDETNLKSNLSGNGNNLFVKGRMIERFGIKEKPSLYYSKELKKLPKSVNHKRLVWRDVSRPSQKRRVQASIIPTGWIAGNSLGVLYLENQCDDKLNILLSIFNSLIFEYQLRFYLTTGHVTLSSIRKVRVPSICFDESLNDETTKYASKLLCDAGNNAAQLEAFAAHLYGVTKSEMQDICSCFKHITPKEVEEILNCMDKIKDMPFSAHKIKETNYIPNHMSAKLSDLDMLTAVNIPEGGNWKNVPVEVPSKRLQTIRESYARGEGSRSTYYGRLRADAPSYTINTYFTRPGNGCHLHYDFEGKQHRVISHREAARFQSFPDNFEFLGSKTAIANQIGNAVPPLLAYQIAKSLKITGAYIDLFSGAGGLSYGFSSAGWECIIANDIDKYSLNTHSKNISGKTLLGDIKNPEIKEKIIEAAENFRTRNPKTPLWIIGGPPCQGFSTAGKKRTRDDERNHLFWDYKEIIDTIKPDGFIFENVSGILSMEKGAVFKEIKEQLGENFAKISHWTLTSESYAVPQRRKRVFLVGTDKKLNPPSEITSFNAKKDLLELLALPLTVTASEAIGDLPALSAGEDGSHLMYKSKAASNYQRLMRNELNFEEYLSAYF